MYFALSVGPRLITGNQKLPGWGKLISAQQSNPNEKWLDPNSPGAVEAPPILILSEVGRVASNV